MKTLYDNEFVFLWEFHDDIVHNEHFYVLNGLGFVHWSSSQEVLRVSMCQESLARSEVRENRASKPPTDAACNDSWLCCCCRRKHSARGPNIWEGEFTNLLGLGSTYLLSDLENKLIMWSSYITRLFYYFNRAKGIVPMFSKYKYPLLLVPHIMYITYTYYS